MFLGAVISIAYTPFMLRTLGQSEYGLYNLASSIISYLTLLNFGFGSSYIRFYSRYKKNDDNDNIARLNSLFLIVFSIMGLLALFGGIVLAQNVKLIFNDGLNAAELEHVKVLMYILSFSMCLSFPASIFTTYTTSQEKFVAQKLLSMIKTVVTPLTMVLILMMGYKSIGMVIITFFITSAVDIFNASFCLKKLRMKFLFKKLNFRVLYEVAGFSIFIALNSIIDQINWNVDKLIIGRYRGTVGVAVYGISAQLNVLYMQFSSSISSVFTPRIHKLITEKQSHQIVTEIFTKVGRIQFIILALVSSGLVLFGKPFIFLWAGEEYADSYYIALLLIIPVTVPLIQNLGIEIQRAYNMHRFRSIIYIIMALVNVIISIPLCIYYGGIGNAVGTAISLIIANGFIMNVYYHVKLHIDMKYFWLQIIKVLPSIVIPIFVGSLLSKYINCYSLKYLLICIILYVVVYIISVWFLGMNEYEKGIISKPVNRIKLILSKKHI